MGLGGKETCADPRAQFQRKTQKTEYVPEPAQVEKAVKELEAWQAGKEPILTVTPDATVTARRPIPKDLDERGLHKPAVARACEAATVEHPHGTKPGPHTKLGKTRSVLQQHIDFFDTNGDGIITMWDTYMGFRRIGFNIPFSIWAVFVVNPAFSLASSPGWLPDPFLRIFSKNIHRGVHGSDQHVYDREGRFRPQQYEEVFYKWDRGNKGGLSFRDLWEMTQRSFELNDFFGWFASKFEWFTLWLCTADHRGLVTKEAVRSCYDGSLFYKMEQKWWHKQRPGGEYDTMGDGTTFSALWKRLRGQPVKPEFKFREPEHTKVQ